MRVFRDGRQERLRVKGAGIGILQDPVFEEMAQYPLMQLSQQFGESRLVVTNRQITFEPLHGIFDF